jgi:hypothetical protein
VAEVFSRSRLDVGRARDLPESYRLRTPEAGRQSASVADRFQAIFRLVGGKLAEVGVREGWRRSEYDNEAVPRQNLNQDAVRVAYEPNTPAPIANAAACSGWSLRMAMKS